MQMKQRFKVKYLRCMLHEYTCSSCYPNLTKKLKSSIQVSQNKYIRFCLQLDKMTHISHTPN